MTLKDKILKKEDNVSCSKCKNFEMLKSKIPYCKNSDKLIIDFQVDIIRKCKNFEKEVKSNE